MSSSSLKDQEADLVLQQEAISMLEASSRSRNIGGDNDNDKKRPLNIVITGCSSGIGLQACKLIHTVSPESRLFMVARNYDNAIKAIEDVVVSTTTTATTTAASASTSASTTKTRIKRGTNDYEYRHNLIPFGCDHTNLNDVRKFCHDLKSMLDKMKKIEESETGTGTTTSGQQQQQQHRRPNAAVGSSCCIDVLCLNAAIYVGGGEELSQPQYTMDGIEVTVQTNHFAPFVIATELLDYINPNSGRVVISSSGLHAMPTTTFGNFQGILIPNHDTDTAPDDDDDDEENNNNIQQIRCHRRFGMIDGTPYHHKQCYAISKLCNVTFCMELNRRLQQRHHQQQQHCSSTTSNNNSTNTTASSPTTPPMAICFTPGLIPTSGLFRHQEGFHESCLQNAGAASMIEREEWGGVFLAWMALSDQATAGAEQGGGIYWRAPFGISNRGGKVPDDLYIAPIAEEAQSVHNQQMLWNISTLLTSKKNDDDDNNNKDTATDDSSTRNSKKSRIVVG